MATADDSGTAPACATETPTPTVRSVLIALGDTEHLLHIECGLGALRAGPGNLDRTIGGFSA